jgi:integrase
MTTNLKVSFYLKRERKNAKSGSYPIVGKIIVGRSIAQFSSKLKVEERLWNVKSGRAIGKSHAATELNRELNKINLLIHSHYSEILQRTGKVTAIEVKNAFQGIASTQKTLFVLFEEIMQEFYSRVGIDRALSSYRQYINTQKHLQRFLKEKYKVLDIPLSQLDLAFIENFDFYLRIERKLKPSSVNKAVIQLLSAAKVALHRNYISRPPFFGYRLQRPVFQSRSLLKEEFERIVSTAIQDFDLYFTRDLYMFSFYMRGMSFVDMANLRKGNLKNGYIVYTRSKTKQTLTVKVEECMQEIIKRYEQQTIDDYLLPIYTVQNRDNTSRLRNHNKRLKRISEMLNLEKPLSSYVSRHTWATIALRKGVSIEIISESMGHENETTTRIYLASLGQSVVDKANAEIIWLE